MSGAALAVRVERQAVLFNAAKRFEFVVMESVPRTRLVPAGVLFAQLEHLATMAQLPNVELAIRATGRDAAGGAVHRLRSVR